MISMPHRLAIGSKASTSRGGTARIRSPIFVARLSRSMMCQSIGSPQRSARTLLGRRVLPSRAWITVTILDIEIPPRQSPQLGLRRLFARQAAELRPAEGAFERANLAHQFREAVWLNARRLIASPQTTIEGEVTFDDLRTERHGAERGEEADFMTAVADHCFRSVGRGQGG